MPQLLKRVNQTNSNIGGWEDSDIRRFMSEELFIALPETLQSIIKPVYKISDGGSNHEELVTTVDNCWLASADEVGLSSLNGYLQGQGDMYSAVFSNNKNSRKKYIMNEAVAGGWWLRSSYYSLTSSGMFWRVTDKGGSYSDIAFNYFYIAFGFCV